MIQKCKTPGCFRVYTQKMAWMQGFSPPPDRTISVIDGSFFKFPALRYSVCDMRQFMPTVKVPAAQQGRYDFGVEYDGRVDQLTFIPQGEQKPMTWEASLQKNQM